MNRSDVLLTWLEQAGRDFRHTLRSLARSKAFTAIVVMTLGFGIGANTAVFSAMNAVVLTPLRVPGADQLVRS